MKIEINDNLLIAQGTLEYSDCVTQEAIRDELYNRGYIMGNLSLTEDLLNNCYRFKANVIKKPAATAPELKPCPFCGGKPFTIHHSNTFADQKIQSIKCPDCQASILGIDDEAARKWNKRAAKPIAKLPKRDNTREIERNDTLHEVAQALMKQGFEIGVLDL